MTHPVKGSSGEVGCELTVRSSWVVVGLTEGNTGEWRRPLDGPNEIVAHYWWMGHCSCVWPWRLAIGICLVLYLTPVWLLCAACPLLVWLTWMGASGCVLPWTKTQNILYHRILCIIEWILLINQSSFCFSTWSTGFGDVNDFFFFECQICGGNFLASLE